VVVRERDVDKSVDLTWQEGLTVDGASALGGTVRLEGADDRPGLRPTEGLLASLGACGAMDVASILTKKRQAWDRYEVHVEGDQTDERPERFASITLVHEIEGPELAVEAVRRSIELSATRYCPVNATLSTGKVEIHHRYRVRNAAGEHAAEVVRTGPDGAIELGDAPQPEATPAS
jgi:putative redox protein